MGPCMCGDLRCFSCGPAQGNHKCEICGKWLDDGGCDDPEACNAAADEMYRKLAEDEVEEQKLAAEFWRKEAEAGRYGGKKHARESQDRYRL